MRRGCAGLLPLPLAASEITLSVIEFTNAERRINRVRKVMAPRNGFEDWEVTQLLANVLGATWSYTHPREILAELAERMAQRLPAQRRPTPIVITDGATRWQVGAAYRGYFADPDILRHDGRWFAYATNAAGLRLPTSSNRRMAL